MDNKFNVEKINNKLFSLNAKIYENNKNDLLHASGHACQEDLKIMIRLVNPKYFMPIHGNFRMLKEHSYLAEELGIPTKNIFVCENGRVIEERKKEFFLSKIKIKSNPNFVFNGRLIMTEDLEKKISTRKKMSSYGVVFIVLFFKKQETRKE